MIISAAVAVENEATTGKSIVVAVSLVEAPSSAEESLGALSLVEESLEAPPLDALSLTEAPALVEALSIEACRLRHIIKLRCLGHVVVGTLLEALCHVRHVVVGTLSFDVRHLRHVVGGVVV